MEGGGFDVVLLRDILRKESREEKEKNKDLKGGDGMTQKPKKQRVRERRTENIKCRNINSPEQL